MTLRNTTIWVAACTLSALSSLSVADAAWVWHPDAGWMDTAQAAAPTAEGLFRRAVALKMQGNVNSALELLLRVEASRPMPLLRQKVLYHIADCHLHLDEFALAEDVCDRLEIGQLPDALRSRVLALRLEAGSRWSRSESAEGVRALRALKEKARGREVYPEVLVALGDAEVRASLFDKARETYLDALETAAAEQLLGKALFGAGWADVLHCRDKVFEAPRIVRALDLFEQYLDRFPRGALAERAEECVWICRSLREEYSEERRKVFFSVTYLLAGDADLAYPTLKKAARKYRETYVGEAATFYLAEYHFLQGDAWQAFRTYEELMEKYPGTTRVRKVVEREYEIGRRLMATFHGWRWRGWTLSRAITALDTSIDHNPSGPHAADAQLLVGDAYMEKGIWEEAYIAYETLIENYPGSEWVPTARFKSGLARFRQAELTEDKSELLMRANRSLEVYLRNNPSGAFAEEAKNLTRRIRSREAALSWRIARFYERTNETEAAAFVLGRIVQDYPDTAWADVARKRLGAYETYELTK